MTTPQQNANGTWAPATPLPISDTLDFEVAGHGPYRWDAWRGTQQVATGTARTRLGLTLALFRARRKHATPAV